MSLPNNGSQPKCYELPLHSLSCSGLCISVDGRSLVTVGEDGVIFILSIQGLASHDELALLPVALHVTDMDKFSEQQSILASKEEILKLERRCESLMAECRAMKDRKFRGRFEDILSIVCTSIEAMSRRFARIAWSETPRRMKSSAP